MYEFYVKRPADTINVEFDFREFVARASASGVAATDIRFAVRAAPGITVASSMDIPGLVDCTVSGGDMGRVYQIGLDAATPDGESQAEVRKVRVRDPSLFGLLPASGETVFGGVVLPPKPSGALSLDGVAIYLDSALLSLAGGIGQSSMTTPIGALSLDGLALTLNSQVLALQ